MCQTYPRMKALNVIGVTMALTLIALAGIAIVLAVAAAAASLLIQSASATTDDVLTTTSVKGGGEQEAVSSTTTYIWKVTSLTIRSF
jgi:hypothetical protein